MKEKIKIFFCLFMACICMLITANADEAIKVYVNGKRLNDNVILSRDRTYIPLRAVSEAMGAEVIWEENSKSVYVNFTEDDMVAQIAYDVSPSVVSIIGNYKSSSESSKYNNPTIHGSGVIYKNNGYIITNAHVVKDITNITVVLNDGSSWPGDVLFSDETADLAIIKIYKLGLIPIKMAEPESVVSGKTAIAIGTPISMSMRNTVTKGIVCGNNVTISDSYYKLLQTDATINPGNSGGPLLNIKGELIGINSSKYTGMGIENMAFAIPVDTVIYAISQFESYGKILRPDFKITLEQSWEAKIGLPTNKGLIVKQFDGTNLKEGDMITAVNGIEVHSITDWNEALKNTYNGKDAVVSYIRDGVQADTIIYG